MDTGRLHHEIPQGPGAASYGVESLARLDKSVDSADSNNGEKGEPADSNMFYITLP